MYLFKYLKQMILWDVDRKVPGGEIRQLFNNRIFAAGISPMAERTEIRKGEL
jgi:hypothetical protein